MKSKHDVRRLAIAWSCLVVASAACASRPQPNESPSPAPGTPLADVDMTLVRADSEVFAAVVQAQQAASSDDDDYPRHLESVRFDARPYGSQTGYPENFAGVQGIDPTLTFGRAGESEIADLVDHRRAILDANGIPEGNSLNYRQCAGAGVPVPPPPRRRTKARVHAVDVHAGCPSSPEYYITVGLPVRGQPPGLKNARNLKGHRVSLKGDVWSVLVDEHSAGPTGWTWSQYAWLFRRNRSGQLELADTILIGVVD
jgi:hypothetical protein